MRSKPDPVDQPESYTIIIIMKSYTGYIKTIKNKKLKRSKCPNTNHYTYYEQTDRQTDRQTAESAGDRETRTVE